MNEQTSTKIKNLMLLLAILVVYRHSVNYTYYHITSKFIYWFEMVGMNISDTPNSIFFTLSAFLFYQNYNKSKFGEKLKGRFFSLVIPFVVWNFIGFLYFQALALVPAARAYYGGNIDSFSIINLIKGIISTDYNMATWFLKDLIVYTFLFPFIYPLAKNKKMGLMLFAFFLFINIYFFNLGIYTAYVIYYYLGMFMAIHYKDLVTRRYSKKAIVIAGIIYAITIIITSGMYTRYSNPLMPLMRIVQITSFWIFADMLVSPNPLTKLSKFSFVMFLSHDMILEPIEKVLFIVFGDHNIWALIDYVATPLITIAIIVFVAGKVYDFKPYKFITGGR